MRWCACLVPYRADAHARQPQGATLAESNANLDKIVALAEQLQGARGRCGGAVAPSNEISALSLVPPRVPAAAASGTVKPLWGTAALFKHARYMHGAATSPQAAAFAHAAAQVKKAMEVTQRLGGEAYVFWGGREGCARKHAPMHSNCYAARLLSNLLCAS